VGQGAPSGNKIFLSPSGTAATTINISSLCQWRHHRPSPGRVLDQIDQAQLANNLAYQEPGQSARQHRHVAAVQ